MAKIETIEGIGPKYRKALDKAGVRTTQGLLAAGGAKKGRKELAKASGCSEHQILEWVNRADLMRISGVGTQYSDLLEAAGVDTVVELAQRNAENLYKKMADVNAAKKLVRQIPSVDQVKDWVSQAAKLPRVISH